MKKEVVFYRCKRCGNVARKDYDMGPPLVCCGEEMVALKANTQDAAQEKHVPVVKVEGNRLTVDVGSVEHPMVAEHHIPFIYVETKNGGLRADLQVGSKPHATFTIDANDKAVAVYEYCNLHGLWKFVL
ncbi:MAG: Desulfoferrodoxin [Spirochaetes bacterium ADurb.Bin315]|jgi:superoxide reductase|nr:desulfoferrodoxin family protein [Spirochaetota bacterium]OQA44071.1 MAG: Desulfoferrodoxin [Spirochaetes bacterium ADurb.Bin315]TAH58306.1 MAG: desulfoferrodoxin [Sphaerochaeta sp.]HOE89369.1 desulfoferrodoxin family protein [Sphaerochaeta sp.]HOR80145.1 desulfoferrodoxin family protein [Sphaerochaeta sp.]